MSEPANPQWEYRVEDFGGIIKREPKKEEFESLLNSWGEEGWEIISDFYHTGTSRLRIIAKRPLTNAVRRKRSMAGLEADLGLGSVQRPVNE
jgi:hypothetical protein